MSQTPDPTTASASRLRRLIPYLARYRTYFTVGSVLLVATNVLALRIPREIGRAVQLLRDAGEAGVAVDVSPIGRIALTIVALAAAAGITRVFSRITVFNGARHIEYDIRNEVFAHLARLDQATLDRESTGDLVSRCINDVTQIRLLFGVGILNLVNTGVAYVIVLGLMLSVSTRLTLLSLAPYPFILLAMRWFTRALFSRSMLAQQQLSVVSARAQEALSGIAVVKSFAIEDQVAARFAEASRDYVDRNLEVAVARGGLMPFMRVAAGTGALVVLWAGGNAVMRGTMPLGRFVEFSAYAVGLAWPTMALGWVLAVYNRGSAAFDRTCEVLALRPEVDPAAPASAHLPEGNSVAPTHPPEGSAPRPPEGSPPTPASRPPEGSPPTPESWADPGRDHRVTTLAAAPEIRFDHVSMVYPTGLRALADIELTVHSGSTVAVVGPTGAGKSSLVQLVPRLRDPTEGTLLVGGVPARDVSLADLRSRIGYVPQTSFLFSRTLRENILLGAPADADLERAVQLAGLEPDLAALPDGIDTVVGERGVTLSGGQRQRATLARALARDPQILVLDDALSAVDTRTERAILEGLRSVFTGRTTLLVTHRYNALDVVDEIVVLEAGRIVERGVHRDLVAAGGRYAELVEEQRLEEEAAGFESEAGE